MTRSFRYSWDYSDYARLPDDGNHYEVIDGELLVTPGASPDHQHIAITLGMQLKQYVERHQLGVVLPDVDVLFVEGNFLRPDLVFVPADRKHGISRRGIEEPPGLIVEILSPTSSSIDLVRKPRRYGDFGVPEYWVVDPEERCIWVWAFAKGLSEAQRFDRTMSWQPRTNVDALMIDVPMLLTPL